MAFPAGMTLITVTGRAVTIDDAPVEAVLFTCDRWLTGPAADTIVAPFKIHATPDLDGDFTVQLPATNDPAWTPQGWSYDVRITRGAKHVWGALTVPYDGGTFDLADRVNLDDVAALDVDTYVTLAMRGTANGVAALDGTGKVPAAQLPASAGGDPAWSEITGKPEEFPPSDHTHAIADVTGLQTSLNAKANTVQLDDLADDVAALDVRVTALEEAPGGGGGTTMQVRRAIVTSGSLTAQNTSGGWAVLTGGPTLTIPAVAGDYISAEIMGVLIQPNSGTFYELAVINGTPVRYGSTGTSTPAVEGDPALYPDAAFQGRGGPVLDFVAQAGDINAGNITIGIAVNSTASGSRTLYASAAFPLRWRVINHGQADMA
jgi:hypothetical protein